MKTKDLSLKFIMHIFLQLVIVGAMLNQVNKDTAFWFVLTPLALINTIFMYRYSIKLSKILDDGI